MFLYDFTLSPINPFKQYLGEKQFEILSFNILIKDCSYMVKQLRYICNQSIKNYEVTRRYKV